MQIQLSFHKFNTYKTKFAEAQLAINELQIDDLQDAKYEIAKNINKITTKHTQTQPKKNAKN